MCQLLFLSWNESSIGSKETPVEKTQVPDVKTTDSGSASMGSRPHEPEQKTEEEDILKGLGTLQIHFRQVHLRDPPYTLDCRLVRFTLERLTLERFTLDFEYSLGRFTLDFRHMKM
jgi:hypothetical protein